ncbi:MAG: hypothetical protein AB7V62_12530 [Thermoleophilia bacterium]
MGVDPNQPDPAAEVEARLLRLHRYLGMEGDPLSGRRGVFSREVLALVAQGRTTDAARRHRDETGCDLQTAILQIAEISPV